MIFNKEAEAILWNKDSRFNKRKATYKKMNLETGVTPFKRKKM